MTVRELECQIAKSQISRYVAGEVMSPDAMGQLEKHVQVCPDCKSALSERRTALLQLLEKKAPKTAAIFVDVEDEPLHETLGEKLRRKASEKAASAPKAAPKNITKPLLYSAALAGVLLAMSYVSNNMNSITGGKLLDSNAPAKTEAVLPTPTPEPTPAPAVMPEPQTTPSYQIGKSFATAVIAEGVQNVEAETIAQSSATTQPVQPKPAERQATPRPSTPRVSRPKATRRTVTPKIHATPPAPEARPSSGIKVYLDGKTVNK
jgi:hypothetical protein